MRDIDPNDPIYKNITKQELHNLKYFSLEEKEAMSMRLFGEALYQPLPWEITWEEQRDQRWKALLDEVPPQGTPYKATHKRLMQMHQITRARIGRNRTGIGENAPVQSHTVSGFADWVLRLYVSHRDPLALMAGVIGERAVVDYRSKIDDIKREIPRWEHRGWKLIHDGVRGVFDRAFSIPSLSVNGVTLVGVPDLVFRERRTGRVLIVELKVSSADLPSDGWPNLRAQLWAYSRIEQWCAAPDVLLAGEVWSNGSGGLFRRRTYLWRRGELQLEEECTELFKAYGGQVTASL